MEVIAPQSFQIWAPASEDFEKFDDLFEAFNEWVLALFQADEEAGAHVVEMVENSADAFQLTCVYCTWHERANQLGVKEACLPNCYSDDVFLSTLCRPLDIEYMRTTTLAK